MYSKLARSLFLLVSAVTVGAALLSCHGATKTQANGADGSSTHAVQVSASVAQAQDTVTATLLPPPQVPPPVNRGPAHVEVNLEAVETRQEIAPGVEYNFWTFNSTTPGPMIRVRQGDTIDLHLKNRQDNTTGHNIDLHAVNGPGGGAAVTNVPPGSEASFQWKALTPGLYVYHCAFAPAPEHIANGMYGMILVEPEGGLPPVDREYYVMQGDFYTEGDTGAQGLQPFSKAKLLSEQPTYVVFNGNMQSLIGDKALPAKVGETVRIYFGNGGPNLVSSFHVIGEIFDRVYDEASIISPPRQGVQTTLVPAGGATIVDFKVDVPGSYTLVDHSISRVLKGAAGQIKVEGAENPDIFKALTPGAVGGH